MGVVSHPGARCGVAELLVVRQVDFADVGREPGLVFAPARQCHPLGGDLRPVVAHETLVQLLLVVEGPIAAVSWSS